MKAQQQFLLWCIYEVLLVWSINTELKFNVYWGYQVYFEFVSTKCIIILIKMLHKKMGICLGDNAFYYVQHLHF